MVPAASMASKKELVTRSCSNSEKVRICRLFLLTPVACVLVVCFVLLLYMKVVPDMDTSRDNVSRSSSCLVVNCTVKHRVLDSLCTAPLSGLEKSERLISEGQRCLRTVVWFLGAGDVLHNIYNHTEEIWCFFCYEESTKSKLNEREDFLKRWERNHTENRCTIVDSVNLKPDNCSAHTKHEDEAEQRMRKNSKGAALVLIIILSLFIMVIFFMFLCTPKLIKVCCHLCYDDEAQ